MGDPDISTSVRIAPELLGKIDQIAESEKVSRADVIRWFLEDGVAAHSKKGDQSPTDSTPFQLIAELAKRMEKLEREVHEGKPSDSQARQASAGGLRRAKSYSVNPGTKRGHSR